MIYYKWFSDAVETETLEDIKGKLVKWLLWLGDYLRPVLPFSTGKSVKINKGQFFCDVNSPESETTKFPFS